MDWNMFSDIRFVTSFGIAIALIVFEVYMISLRVRQDDLDGLSIILGIIVISSAIIATYFSYIAYLARK